MKEDLKEGQFLLLLNGQIVAESISATEIIGKHNELRRKGGYDTLTTLKVVLHDEQFEKISET